MMRAIPILLVFIIPILFILAGCGEEKPNENTEPVDVPQAEASSAEIALMEADVIDRLGRIRIGIERYAVKNEGYPPEITLILEELDMEDMPINPFTNEPMLNIKFGTKPFEGEFVYLPVLSEEIVKGYFLFAYGSEETEGQDLNKDRRDDHVIELISNSLEGFELPPIEEALEMLRKSGRE